MSSVTHFDVLNEKDIDSIIAGELLELKENKALKANIERNGLIGWLSVGSFYPLLFEKVVPFLLGFSATWLVEAGFSAVNDLLTKKRHQLQIETKTHLHHSVVFLGKTLYGTFPCLVVLTSSSKLQ